LYCYTPIAGGSPYTVHNWIEEAPTAHASGIKVQDSQIIVNKSGLYLVYSQILFSDLYKGQSTLNTSQVLYHYVYVAHKKITFVFVYYNSAKPKNEACGSLDILSIFEALTNSWSPELS
jgi:hypothetical protein